MNKVKIIYKILVALMLIALICMMIVTLQKTANLEYKIYEFQEKIDELEREPSQNKDHSSISSESESEQFQNDFQTSEDKRMEISGVNNNSSVESQREVLDANSDTESATSNTPVQTEYVSSIINLPAGTVLPNEEIDIVNISQYFTIHMIVEGDEVYDRINGKSYVPNDYITLENLRYIKLLHRNYASMPQVGELIVNVEIAEDVVEIFTKLFQQNYQICSMHLIDDYWVGDGEKSDNASVEVDNTSAFCYRFIIGSETNLSNHAYGLAIDLNPLENPYVVVHEDGSKTTYHENSQKYIYDRLPGTPHVIDENDTAYKLFTEYGFTWGGKWDAPIDYQHFEKSIL